VPRLWSETIEAHRRDVREAILDTTAALVAEHGLRSVTMAQIAERTGIGRATLYKYFPHVEAILIACHDRHVEAHLRQLTAAREGAEDPAARVHAVLAVYAHIVHAMSRHDLTELAAVVHRDEHATRTRRQLHDLVRDVLAEAARDNDIRTDIIPGELATYCLHALSAAADLPSKAAIDRLVMLTSSALRAAPGKASRRR